jgi:hypothetical protein
MVTVTFTYGNGYVYGNGYGDGYGDASLRLATLKP